MNTRILDIVIPIPIIVMALLSMIYPSTEITAQKTNEKIGLVINSPGWNEFKSQIQMIN